MKTFVINLEKNKERLKKIDMLLRRHGVPYVRMGAIYGKDLPAEQKKVSSNRFAWWCIKGYAMRDGELGAALSHELVYKKMHEDDIPVACVFEDDANPNECLTRQLREIEAVIDLNKSQVYLLSDHTGERKRGWLIRRLKQGAFAEGYVLTLPAARVLLKDNFPVKTPADSWTYWAHKGLIELYQTTPASCDQAWQDEGYQSDVTPNSRNVVDVRRLSVVGRLIWKAKRATGMLLAAIFYR